MAEHDPTGAHIRFHPYLYSQGVGTDLGNLAASAINNSGQMTGTFSDAVGGTGGAFLTTTDGQVLNLGTLPGYSFSYGEALNNKGQVAGSAQERDGMADAFIYSGGVMQNLNQLIDPMLGLRLTHVVAINDYGQILAGYGPVGQTGNYLLTPLTETVPEPGTAGFLLTAAVAGALASVLRRYYCPTCQKRIANQGATSVNSGTLLPKIT